MSKLRAVSITEDNFYKLHEFESEEKLAAYAAGFSDGADAYGAGGAGVYTLADLVENGGELDATDKRYPIIVKHLQANS